MKEIIHNNDKVKEEEITEIVIRTKALIINDNNEILLANENDVLQFPGGHLEENEDLTMCLKREILEETGITINDDEISDCFLKVIFKNRNWPSAGKNRKAEIYYFVVNTNKQPNLSRISLTESEKNQNFKVDYISLDNSIDYIKSNISKNEKNNVISPDMLSALEEFFKIRKI